MHIDFVAVCGVCIEIWWINQEDELIKLRREARLTEGFYIEPEAKLLFVIRIKGIMKMHPKVRNHTILYLLGTFCFFFRII